MIMEALTNEFYTKAMEAEISIKEYDKKLLERFSYVLNSICEKFGKKKLNQVYLDPQSLRRIALKDYNANLIYHSNIYGYNTYNDYQFNIMWENKIVNLAQDIPLRWLDWNFEDELDDGKKEYEEFYLKEKERKKLAAEIEMKEVKNATRRLKKVLPKDMSVVEKLALKKIIGPNF